jgi:hypothetical protein
MTITDPASTNSLGEVEAEPQQTDNGPKDGDAEVDQDSVELPSAGEHEGAGLAGAVLAAAMSHRGTIESPPGSNRTPFGAAYGWNGVAWCNIFVSRMGFEVVGDYDLLGKFAGTIACAQWWQKQGRFGSEPRPGATVFFDWKGGRSIGAIDHIGLVIEALGNGRVRTIEGNAAIQGKSDGVWVHDRSTSFIVGDGYPRYADGVAGAAPQTAARAAARPVAVAAKTVAVPAFPGLMVRGRTGAGVRALQQRLKDRGWKITVDGEFGPQTDRIVRAFQKDKGLTVDGEVGPHTWSALWTTAIT